MPYDILTVLASALYLVSVSQLSVKISSRTAKLCKSRIMRDSFEIIIEVDARIPVVLMANFNECKYFPC